MTKVYRLKLFAMSRTYGRTKDERMAWIRLQLRNDAKRLAAIHYLGEKWVLAKQVRRAA